MGRRTLLKRHKVLDQDSTAISPVSDPTDVSGVDFITYQLVVDPTVQGVLNVYFCNTDKFDPAYVGKLNFGQANTINGSIDTNYMAVIENKGFKHLLIELENNGGTGNVSAWISGNVRGA